MARLHRLLLSTAVLLGLAGLSPAATALPPVSGEPPDRPALGDDGPAAGPAEEGPPPAAPEEPLSAWFAPAGRGPAVARGHVVVRFARDVPGWQRRQIVQAAGGISFKAARMGSFAKVGVAAGDAPEALVERLSGMPGIVSAELDPIARALGLEARAAPDKRRFTDPLVNLQWSYDRIRLPEALDLNATDGQGVIVAVIDSGVASGSGASFPARRGLDLEATAFLPGADFVDGGPPYDEGSGGGSPSSPRFGHGTYVAAQIAATVNNGLAGASVAPRATILPLRVLGTSGQGFFSDVADAIDFAVNQGARVINLSLGGSQGAEFLQAAIRRAHQAGVVIVAAAGNEAEEPDFGGDVAFPARYPEVIAVGSSAFDDTRADYSNHGPGLDLMAPAGEDPSVLVGQGRRDAAVSTSFVHDPVSGETIYASFFGTGTSFAAPQAAGVAALLVALGVRDPAAIRLLLIETARDLAERGRDDQTGAGLLDAFEAHRGFGFAF
jgi:subtilisin family serine protease